MQISGNRQIDDAMEAALDSGDIDKIDAAFAAVEREGRRKTLALVAEEYRKAKEHDGLHIALAMWFERPEAQHEPPADRGKGRLTDWTERDGVRLPTIRRDMVEAAIAGAIEYQGNELLCHLTGRLDPDAKAYLLAIYRTVEKTVKAKRDAVETAKESAFAAKPTETPASIKAAIEAEGRTGPAEASS